MSDYPYEYYNRKRAKRKAFFIKAVALLILFALLIAAVSGIFFFSAKKIGVSLPVYLLAAEPAGGESEESVSAKGGAGIDYEDAGTNYTLYACYYGQEDAQTVLMRLRAAGENVVLLAKEGGKLYFRGRAERGAGKTVSELITAAYVCSEALYAVANRLEAGGIGQSAAKEGIREPLRVLSQVFEGAREAKLANKKKFRDFFTFDETLSAAAETALSGSVTAGAARRLQAMLCVYYLSAFEIFDK